MYGLCYVKYALMGFYLNWPIETWSQIPIYQGAIISHWMTIVLITNKTSYPGYAACLFMLRTAHLTTHAQKGSVLQALHHDCVEDIRHTTSKQTVIKCAFIVWKHKWVAGYFVRVSNCPWYRNGDIIARYIIVEERLWDVAEFLMLFHFIQVMARRLLNMWAT